MLRSRSFVGYLKILKKCENKVLTVEDINKELNMNENQLRVFLSRAKKKGLIENIGRGKYVVFPPEISVRSLIQSSYLNKLVKSKYILNILNLKHAFADLALNYYSDVYSTLPMVLVTKELKYDLRYGDFIKVSKNLLENLKKINYNKYEFEIPSLESEILFLTYLGSPRHRRAVVDMLKMDVDVGKILRRAAYLKIFPDITKMLKLSGIKFDISNLEPEKTEIILPENLIKERFENLRLVK